MALRVVWSAPAQAQRRAVLTYWLKRHGNAEYSRKLDMRFRSALRIIARNPRIGRPSSFEGVRMKTVGDYLLFCRLEEKIIVIAALWDYRQDPEKLRVS
ncbi:MAG: type II toxin-antitoxin system RelE/ParE family toxin [Flavobacteriales bacterium]|nr:type II toxin-antitoxin system RelE/ParE family toxin [Flavobacteriales bacterium]